MLLLLASPHSREARGAQLIKKSFCPRTWTEKPARQEVFAINESPAIVSPSIAFGRPESLSLRVNEMFHLSNEKFAFKLRCLTMRHFVASLIRKPSARMCFNARQFRADFYSIIRLALTIVIARQECPIICSAHCEHSHG